MEGGIAPGPRHRSSTSPSSAGATAAIQLPAVVTASSTATPPSTTVRLPVVPLAATPASSSKARLSLAQVLLTRLAASSILLLLFVTLRSWLSDYPEYGKPRLAPHSPSVRGCRDGFLEAKNPREKAAILILARDDDLGSLLPTIDNFEAKFNGRFQYPYVFLNNEPFSDDFVSKVRQALPKGRKTEFGLIGKEMWSVPEWIGEQKAEAAFKQQEENRVQYAGRAGYHHMCRSAVDDSDKVTTSADSFSPQKVLFGALCTTPTARKVRLVLATRARWSVLDFACRPHSLCLLWTTQSVTSAT